MKKITTKKLPSLKKKGFLSLQPAKLRKLLWALVFLSHTAAIPSAAGWPESDQTEHNTPCPQHEIANSLTPPTPLMHIDIDNAAASSVSSPPVHHTAASNSYSDALASSMHSPPQTEPSAGPSSEKLLCTPHSYRMTPVERLPNTQEDSFDYEGFQAAASSAASCNNGSLTPRSIFSTEVGQPTHQSFIKDVHQALADGRTFSQEGERAILEALRYFNLDQRSHITEETAKTFFDNLPVLATTDNLIALEKTALWFFNSAYFELQAYLTQLSAGRKIESSRCVYKDGSLKYIETPSSSASSSAAPPESLRCFPTELLCLQQLSFLEIRATDLSILPPHLDSLPALKTLIIKSDWLLHLPEAFGHLPLLEKLQLMCPRLSELPKSFNKLTKLQYLMLGPMCFSEVPFDANSLSGLKTIIFNGTDIEQGAQEAADFLSILLEKKVTVVFGCQTPLEDRAPSAAWHLRGQAVPTSSPHQGALPNTSQSYVASWVASLPYPPSLSNNVVTSRTQTQLNLPPFAAMQVSQLQ